MLSYPAAYFTSRVETVSKISFYLNKTLTFQNGNFIATTHIRPGKNKLSDPAAIFVSAVQ